MLVIHFAVARSFLEIDPSVTSSLCWYCVIVSRWAKTLVARLHFLPVRPILDSLSIRFRQIDTSIVIPLRCIRVPVIVMARPSESTSSMSDSALRAIRFHIRLRKGSTIRFHLFESVVVRISFIPRLTQLSCCFNIFWNIGSRYRLRLTAEDRR